MRHWKDINGAANCPYKFSPEEIRDHLEDASGWNEAQDFFDELDGLVDRDGWTHYDTFEQAREAFDDLHSKYRGKLAAGLQRLNFERYTKVNHKVALRTSELTKNSQLSR